MKIVLREDVETLGRKGDLVDVADGYARNYLVPRGLAMKATKGVVAQAESMRRNRAGTRSPRREAAAGARRASRGRAGRRRRRARARAASSSARSPPPTSPTRCSAQPGIEIDRRSVVLDEPIRELGEVEVPVRLHAEVVVPVVVAVVAQ